MLVRTKTSVENSILGKESGSAWMNSSYTFGEASELALRGDSDNFTFPIQCSDDRRELGLEKPMIFLLARQ